jgi:hypothetical protein
MRPQKSKRYRNGIIQNRFNGYFLEDTDCEYCIYWKGKKRGCILSHCDFEEEKTDAALNGRIKRDRGDEN